MRLAKITELKNGLKLLAYWANNRGRGRDNCSLFVVDGADPRPATAKQAMKIAYAATRTSSWAGNVNLSRRVKSELGIESLI